MLTCAAMAPCTMPGTSWVATVGVMACPPGAAAAGRERDRGRRAGRHEPRRQRGRGRRASRLPGGQLSWRKGLHGWLLSWRKHLPGGQTRRGCLGSHSALVLCDSSSSTSQQLLTEPYLDSDHRDI